MFKTILKAGKKPAMLAALMATCLTPLSAQANEVTLRSSDGSIDLVGKLMEYNDEFYVLSTSLGNLRISSARVRCEGAACPVIETASADVLITGSEAIGVGLMPLLLEGYAGDMEAASSIEATRQQGQIVASLVGDEGYGEEIGSFLVTSTSTSDAFEDLLKKEASVAMASRRIIPDEARALKKDGAGNMISLGQEHIVAVDSIVVITHPDNPVPALSMAQVSDIYSGKIRNWNEVGGPDLAIEVVAREDGSDIRKLFDARVRGAEDAALSSDVLLATDHTQAASFVTDNLGAIGYVGFAFLRGAKPLPLVNECNIAMVPDAFSAKTEEYALQRRMYLYVRGDGLDDATKGFVDYATSEAADNVILKSGFIDLGIGRRSQDSESDRAISLKAAKLAPFETKFANDMLAQMDKYDRLSTTFRFRTGSSKLDERGRLDMERLTAYLGRQEPGSEVMIVGFTDSVGAFGANQALSIQRADQVAKQLLEVDPSLADHVKINTTGYGEIAPTACNVSDTGRSINRRVEVWIKSKA